MAKTKLPSPSEVGSDIDPDVLEAGRLRLRDALRRSGGKFFTYSAELFPFGAEGTLLEELSSAGWNYKLIEDFRDGDYYKIFPK